MKFLLLLKLYVVIFSINVKLSNYLINYKFDKASWKLQKNIFIKIVNIENIKIARKKT